MNRVPTNESAARRRETSCRHRNQVELGHRRNLAALQELVAGSKKGTRVRAPVKICDADSEVYLAKLATASASVL